MSQLKSFVERIEALQAEKKALEEDIREVYAEVKSAGFEKTIVRQVVKARGKGETARDEEEALFDLYWNEVHGLSSHTRDTREGRAA